MQQMNNDNRIIKWRKFNFLLQLEQNILHDMSVFFLNIGTCRIISVINLHWKFSISLFYNAVMHSKDAGGLARLFKTNDVVS